MAFINDGHLKVFSPLHEPSGTPVWFNYGPLGNRPSGITFDWHVHTTADAQGNKIQPQAIWPGSTTEINSSGLPQLGYKVQGTSTLVNSALGPLEKVLVLGEGGFGSRQVPVVPSIAQSGFTVGFSVHPRSDGGANEVTTGTMTNELLSEHHALVAKSNATDGFILGVSGRLANDARGSDFADFQLRAYAHVLQNQGHLSTPIESDRFTHITFTYRYIDGTVNEIVLYKDGRVEASGVTTEELTKDNASFVDRLLTIGGSQTTTSLTDGYSNATGWGHLVSGIYVYDRVLPEGDILQFHNQGGLQADDGIQPPGGTPSPVSLTDTKLLGYYPGISPGYIDISNRHNNLIAEFDEGDEAKCVYFPGPFGRTMVKTTDPSVASQYAIMGGSGLMQEFADSPSFTIAGWFNTQSTFPAAFEENIFCALGSIGTSDSLNGVPTVGFIIGANSESNGIRFRTRLFNGGNGSDELTLSSSESNIWAGTAHHLAFVYDDQTQGASFYVNGELAESGTLAGSFQSVAQRLVGSGYPMTFLNGIPSDTIFDVSPASPDNTVAGNAVGDITILGRPLLVDEIRHLGQSGIEIASVLRTPHDPRLRGFWQGTGTSDGDFLIQDKSQTFKGMPSHLTRAMAREEWDKIYATDSEGPELTRDGFRTTIDPVLGFTSGLYVVMGGTQGARNHGGIADGGRRITSSSDLAQRFIPLHDSVATRSPRLNSELIWNFEVTPSGNVPPSRGMNQNAFNSVIISQGELDFASASIEDREHRLYCYVTSIDASSGSGISIVWMSRDNRDINRVPIVSGTIPYGTPSRIQLHAKPVHPFKNDTPESNDITFTLYIDGQQTHSRPITLGDSNYYDQGDFIVRFGGHGIPNDFNVHTTDINTGEHGLGGNLVRNAAIMIGQFSPDDLDFFATSGIVDSHTEGYTDGLVEEPISILEPSLAGYYRFGGFPSGVKDLSGKGNDLTGLAQQAAEDNVFASQDNAAQNLRFVPGPFTNTSFVDRASGITYKGNTFTAANAIAPLALSGQRFTNPNLGFSISFWMAQRNDVGSNDAQVLVSYGIVPDSVSDTTFNDSSWAVIIDDFDNIKIMLSQHGAMPYDAGVTTEDVVSCGFFRSKNISANTVETFKQGGFSPGHVDAWQHVGWSYDSDTDRIKAYLNGVLVDQQAVNPSGFHIPLQDASRLISFLVPQTGVLEWGVNRAAFDAVITEFNYFNKPISQEQMLFLATHGVVGASGIGSGLLGGFVHGSDTGSGIIGGYVTSLGEASGIIGGYVDAEKGSTAVLGGYFEGLQKGSSGIIGGYVNAIGGRPLNMHTSFYYDADEYDGFEVISYHTFLADGSAHGGKIIESLRDRAGPHHLIPFKRAASEQLFVPGPRGALGSGLVFDGVNDAWFRTKCILMGHSGVLRGWAGVPNSQFVINQSIDEATYGIWIKPDQITETRGIVNIGSGTNGTSWDTGLNLYQEGDTIVARCRGDFIELRAEGVLTIDEWTHIAVTFDNDNVNINRPNATIDAQAILFINGIPAFAKDGPGGQMFEDFRACTYIVGTALSGLPGGFNNTKETLPYFKGALAEPFFSIGIMGSGFPEAIQSGLLNISRMGGFQDAIATSGIQFFESDASVEALWRLDEIDGVMFSDSSLNNHNMEFVGDGTAPEIVDAGSQPDGTFGPGSRFRHNNSFVDASITSSTLRNGDVTDFNTLQTGNFTFACWVRPTISTTANKNAFIMGRASDNASSIANEWGMVMRAGADNAREDNIRLFVSDASTDFNVDINYGVQFWTSQDLTVPEAEMDTAQHLAVVVGTSLYSFYMNGHLVAIHPRTGPIDGTANPPICIGGIADEAIPPFTDTTPFSGIISDAVVFSKALSALEIRALVRDGIETRPPQTASGLLGGYVLGGDDFNVTTFPDAEKIRTDLLFYTQFKNFEDNAGYRDEVGPLRITNVLAHPSSGLPNTPFPLPVSGLVETNPIAVAPGIALGMAWDARTIITNSFSHFNGGPDGDVDILYEQTPSLREFSICFWYAPRDTAFDGNERGIIGIGAGGGATRVGVFHTQNDLRVFFGNGVTQDLDIANSIQLESWQFICITRSGSGIIQAEAFAEFVSDPLHPMFDAQVTTVYTHGGLPQLTASAVSGTVAAFSPSRQRDPLIIGNAFAGNTGSSGIQDIANIAEVSVWRRPLSPAEQRGIMLSGIPIDLPRLTEHDDDLLFLYRLDENLQSDRENSATSPLANDTVNLDLTISGIPPGGSPHPTPPLLVGQTSGQTQSLLQNSINFRNKGFNHGPWNQFSSDTEGAGGLSGSFVHKLWVDQNEVFESVRSNFSFGGWFKLVDPSLFNTSIFGKGASFSGPVHFRGRTGASDIFLEVQGDDSQNIYGLNPPSQDTDPTGPDGETSEVHLVYVFDNGAKESRLYRDGVIINVKRHNVNDTKAIAATGADGDFIVGHFPRFSPTNFSGIITDLFMCDRVMSPDEIRSVVVYGWGSGPLVSGIIGGYVEGIEPSGKGTLGGYVPGVGQGSGLLGGYVDAREAASGLIGGYVTAMGIGESFIGGFGLFCFESSGILGGYVQPSVLVSGTLGGFALTGEAATIEFDGGFCIDAFAAADFDSFVEIQKTNSADFDAEVTIFKASCPPDVMIITPPFSLSGLVPPFDQYFVGHASGHKGSTIVSARWTFGDFSPPDLVSQSGTALWPVSHRFAISGFYTVGFEVIDSIGVHNSDTIVINAASGIPEVLTSLSGVPQHGPATLSVKFTQTVEAIPPDISINASLLRYGDNQTSAVLNTTHVYTETGRYTPIWVIRDSRGFFWSDTLCDGIDIIHCSIGIIV